MSQTKARYTLAIVAPTCFYYQVSLFRQLGVHPRVDLTVYFCSDEALHAQDAREMYHIDRDWGDESELLAGYSHKFLKNWSPKPFYLVWPHGLMNFSFRKEIKNNGPDIVILMSWMNATWWIAIAACPKYKVPFFYMTDANVQAELVGRPWEKWVKKLFLELSIFKAATGFLCAGTANRLLYEFFGGVRITNWSPLPIPGDASRTSRPGTTTSRIASNSGPSMKSTRTALLFFTVGG
jgi:hypothetical protein